MIAEFFAFDAETDIFYFLAGYFEFYRAGVVYEYAVAFIGKIERDGFVAYLTGGTTILIPGGDGLAIFHKGGKLFAEAIYRFGRL